MAKAKATKLLPADVRNRVKEVRRLRFGDILQHPTNPKDHPDFQRQVFREGVTFVGFGSVPLAYASARNDGKLTWVDGNMRGDELPDYEGEVAILDIDDEEAAFLLVTLDPIAALAQANAERMAQTLESIHTDSEVLNSFLEEYGQEMADALGETGDGSLLALTEITIADPKHAVAPGEVWTVGAHVLLCLDVITDWPIWTEHLRANAPNAVFLPYPGPYVPVTSKADQHIFIMVQPDPYIAGHILDRYAELFGEEQVKRYA
jgi:hypothetical protein